MIRSEQGREGGESSRIKEGKGELPAAGIDTGISDPGYSKPRVDALGPHHFSCM
jgi:hypothetical protein